MKKIEVILPCYNECNNIILLTHKILELDMYFNEISRVIVVDDGSTDDTKFALKKLQKEFKDKFSYVSLNKNEGKEYAIQLGLQCASDDYVIIMDADFQDTISSIEALSISMHFNHDMDAIAIVSINTASIIHSVFYPIFRQLTGINIPTNVRDMRIVHTSVIHEILNDYNPFFKAELERRGLKVGYLYRLTGSRRNGSSTFCFTKYCRYALDAILPLATLDKIYNFMLNIGVLFNLIIALIDTSLAMDMFILLIMIKDLLCERRFINEATVKEEIYRRKSQLQKVLCNCRKRR